MVVVLDVAKALGTAKGVAEALATAKDVAEARARARLADVAFVIAVAFGAFGLTVPL